MARARRHTGDLPLLQALQENHTIIAELLLAKGADPNAQGHTSGTTALHSAAHKNRTEIAELLLSHGARVDIPSYLTKPGDVIQVKDRPKSLGVVAANLAESGHEVPDFLSCVDDPKPEGHVLRLPEASDVSIPVQAQLIVELCSK